MLKAEIVSKLKKFVPPLNFELHKGQCGKIGVVGGSFEYTGAPYFAATASLLTGADLAFVFCEEKAAIPIKSYSPELIVYPLMRDSTSPDSWEDAAEKIIPLLSRLDVLIVGPGLGKDPKMLKIAALLIARCVEMEKGLVIDADAISIIQPGFATSWRMVLTPNVNEFKRLSNAFGGLSAQELSRKLGVTIICKDQKDSIYSPTGSEVFNIPGMPRRCGGQGDILTGVLATMLAWCQKGSIEMQLVCAYCALAVTKNASSDAYQKYKRSVGARNILDSIGLAFENLKL